jgi:hypothetical protein
MSKRIKTRPSVIASLAAVALLCGSCKISGISTTLSTGAYTGSIRVSLAHPVSATANNYQLMFAASSAATALGVCVLKSSTILTPPATCQVNGPNYTPIGLLASGGARNYFAAQTALLENGLTLMVVTSDATGTVNDSRTIVFNSVASTPANSSPGLPPTTSIGG